MEITLTQTSLIVDVNGVPARIWEGRTASGIAVHAYITRIAVLKEDDNTQFKEELQECQPPSSDLQGIPLRLIL